MACWTVAGYAAGDKKPKDMRILYLAGNSDWNADAVEKSVIEENVNPNRADNCGCGINVAPLEWVRRECIGDIWKVLIRWEWLAGVVVPYGTDGKIRCEKAELVEVIK